MLLIEKCACPCLLKMGKPSLWLLPVANTTSHVDLTLFYFVFLKLLCCRFLAVDWSLQGRHKLLPDDLCPVLRRHCRNTHSRVLDFALTIFFASFLCFFSCY